MKKQTITAMLNDKTGRWFLACKYATTKEEWDTKDEALAAIPADEESDELTWEY